MDISNIFEFEAQVVESAILGATEVNEQVNKPVELNAVLDSQVDDISIAIDSWAETDRH